VSFPPDVQCIDEIRYGENVRFALGDGDYLWMRVFVPDEYENRGSVLPSSPNSIEADVNYESTSGVFSKISLMWRSTFVFLV
jgi:hypothetical protein